MARYLDNKSIAATGDGRGIGRAEGANVVGGNRLAAMVQATSSGAKPNA